MKNLDSIKQYLSEEIEYFTNKVNKQQARIDKINNSPKSSPNWPGVDLREYSLHIKNRQLNVFKKRLDQLNKFKTELEKL